MKLRGLFTKTADVLFISFRLEERVVNQARPIPGGTGLPENQPDPRRPCIHNPVHPFRATIETLVRAAAHSSLLIGVTIKTRDNNVRNLFDQMFKIAVL
jgi:hypothetical protein